MFQEDDTCSYCTPSREATGQLCAVESPADLVAIDASAGYRGRYFVLMGKLSPLDGIGPEELGLETLAVELATGVHELIIAINPSIEGEATAYYLAELARAKGVPVTRIAHGMPMGGEVESTDGGTLAQALSGRRPV
jgi:recombination protein RecR